MTDFRLTTERLVLRAWRMEDVERFHPLGREERAMRYLGPLMTLADTDRLVAGQIVNQTIFGHCFWPVERRSDGMLIGFCGLNRSGAGAPLEGKIEIGWRLASTAWGQGFAREAAQACLDWGWANLPDSALYSMTVPANTASWGLMKRLGMQRRPDLDFDHPDVPDDSPLKSHIVYAIDRPTI